MRLIERTVRSGYRVYWLRAGVPTSNPPCGVKPTIEGMIRSSP